MIQITPQMRILVAVEPTDFRKGIDGLARQCRQALQSDPFSGALFIFRNRNAKAIKILAYDLCGVPSYVELREAIAPSSGFSLASSPIELHIIRCLSSASRSRRSRRQRKGDLDAHFTVSTGACPIFLPAANRTSSRSAVSVVVLEGLSGECHPPTRNGCTAA
ncbi:MAG: IS66 family insertion sequence element accessory protein TnpB [Acidobacteria bacterium]|nr:IS66 family insertion sequence element accessory protein TnpB [Candidatus Sulfomarinibacter kjeldsenii]